MLKKKTKFFQKNRKLKMIEYIYYIPEIKSNILNEGQLMKKEFEILMKKRSLYLKYN
jgi:hypothetical protein